MKALVSKNISRDYFRDALLKLKGKTNNRPIVVSGIYNHNGFCKQYSFVDIRPFLGKGINTRILCQHLNVRQNDTVAVLGPEDHGKRFFIVGFPSSYKYYGSQRGYLKLEDRVSLPDIFSEDELEKFGSVALTRCFPLDNYKQEKPLSA